MVAPQRSVAKNVTALYRTKSVSTLVPRSGCLTINNPKIFRVAFTTKYDRNCYQSKGLFVQSPEYYIWKYPYLACTSFS